jgi:hypothetical protein
MVSVTCANPSCGKAFTFDPAATHGSAVSTFAEGAGVPKKVDYFPACPYCKSRNTVTLLKRS